MGSLRTTGTTFLILLVVSMVILFAVASVITGETTSGTTTEQDYDQIVEDVLNDLTTYIQIKDQKGKFYEINDEYKLTKIAIMISPLVTQDINLNQLTIQIDNGEFVNILFYKNCSEKILSNSLFENSVWDNLDGSNFCLVSITDLDDSIKDFDLINKNSDNAYLIFKLPTAYHMQKYDEIKLTLFPDTGITRTTILEAPMPMRSVITFE